MSAPTALDSYEAAPAPAPAPARRVPFTQVIAAFEAILAQAQRPLTAEDYQQARKNPVLRDKKFLDAATLGAEILGRRADRDFQGGRTSRARAERVAGAVAFAPSVVGLLPNMVAGSSRWLLQKVAGAPYLGARTEAGVREDVILEAIHAWIVQLQAKLDWMFADRAADSPLPPEAIYPVLQAAARTEAALRAYVAEHPSERVRHSNVFYAAFRSLHEALKSFETNLVAIVFGTAPMPLPPAQERIAVPRLKKRHWAALDCRVYGLPQERW